MWATKFHTHNKQNYSSFFLVNTSTFSLIRKSVEVLL